MANAASPDWMEYIKTFAPLGNWVIIIGGWIFVRKDNNRREDRKELRSCVDSIIKDIKDLEAKAYDYYQGEPGDSSLLLEVEIKRDQDALESRISRLKRTTNGFTSLEEQSKFRQVMTGGDFEQSNRKKCSPKDRKLLEISFAARQLIEYLETEYATLMPDKVKGKSRR